MLKSTIALLSIILSTQLAEAGRYILKNPSSSILEEGFFRPGQPLRVVDAIDFGNDYYVLVRVNERKLGMDPEDIEGISQALADALGSESVQLNSKSSRLVNPVENSEKEHYFPGWHTQRYEYDRVSDVADGDEIIVAVIDTGVDYTHEALKNKIWVNEAEIPNNGFDDDENGFVDDIIGYNFASDSNNPMDRLDHGTHVAGIIAADQHDEYLARGIAPNAKIMALKIFDDQGRFAGDFNAAKAIKYATDNGARLSNNSWGGPGSSEIIKSAVEHANDNDVLFIAAAGNSAGDNDDFQIFPSGYEFDNVISVAASGNDGFREEYPAVFTNFGRNSVDVAAAGYNILSTVSNGEWSVFSGTSMAAPVVTGLVALGLQLGMEPLEAKHHIINSSIPEMEWRGLNRSGGVIDPVRFLSRAK